MADEDVNVPEPKVRKKPGRKSNAERAASAAVQSAGIAPTAEQWSQLMAVLSTNKIADMEVAATIHAQAMKKALRPENEVAPGVSVYNPQGERDHPRPKPTHIYMMGPYPIADPGNYDTVTLTEIELLNQLKPGDFQVTKADGTSVKATIKTEYEGDGTKPRRTWLHIPIANDEQKESWPPLVQVLSEILTGETPMQSYARYQRIIAEQQAEIARLQGAA